jgi:hypothetical protein
MRLPLVEYNIPLGSIFFLYQKITYRKYHCFVGADAFDNQIAVSQGDRSGYTVNYLIAYEIYDSRDLKSAEEVIEYI